MAVAGRTTEEFHVTERVDNHSPSSQVLYPKRLVKLSVDASSKGLGTVLLQDNHPIAYASKALRI